MNNIPEQSAAQLVADLAQAAAGAEVIGIETGDLGPGLPKKIPVLFDRKKQEAKSLRLFIEEFRQEPMRRKGTAKVETLAAFIELVNRHKDEHSAIFASTMYPKIELTAVIDYHTTTHEPRWGGHRVLYQFPLTEEFKTWADMDGNAMEQGDFARFLEDHAAELASPEQDEINQFQKLFNEKFASPNQLIALSRDLEVYVGAKVKRGERLSSGERTVVFEEQHTNSKGEPVEIPGLFIVNVPAWIDGNPIRIPARLRYRLAGSTIAWFYQLYRWQFWLRNEVINDLTHAGKETTLPTFLGAPEV